MKKPVCHSCRRPLPDTTTLCAGCTKILAHDLRRITELWPTLQRAIARQTALGDRSHRGLGHTQPLPVDRTAA